jgi:hypothetical protein
MAKSDMVRGMLFGAEFFTELNKEIVKLGGDEAMMYETMKTSSGLAKDVAECIVRAHRLALQPMELIADGIAVATEAFTKESFFAMNGPVGFWFSDHMKSWILRVIPDTIPAFEGTLRKTELTKRMDDSQILSELGSPNPFSPAEFAAIAKDLISKQPKGKSGTLLTNGCANIFYVKLGDDREVSVGMFWSDGEWFFYTNYLNGDRWLVGPCVFSRS